MSKEAAEVAAREAYGRLVAYLAWQWNDLAAAEDALGDAMLKALERWPHDCVPVQPEAWLLTAAQREVLQSARHQGGVQRIADDPLVRTLMMLRAVLGLDAQRMAAVFLVSPLAMAQRLVRAKQKIAQAGSGLKSLTLPTCRCERTRCLKRCTPRTDWPGSAWAHLAGKRPSSRPMPSALSRGACPGAALPSCTTVCCRSRPTWGAHRACRGPGHRSRRRARSGGAGRDARGRGAQPRTLVGGARPPAGAAAALA